jgi:hypothetical protein
MTMRLGILLVLSAMPSFAGAWTGFLVDSACYASEQDNANKGATTTDRDMRMEVRYCAANANTKHFALVLDDWGAVKLLSAQSGSLSQLARSAPKRSPLEVTVTGDLAGDSIHVQAISARK